jgi:hypothetical protein
MKKIGLALVLFIFCIQVNAQQNTFPSTGNVGIGTTSPTEKLTVNGALKVEQGSILKGEVKMPDLPLATDGVGQGNNQNASQYKFLVVGTDGIVRLRGGNPFPLPSLGCAPVMPDGTPIPTISSWEFGLNKIYTRCPEVNVGINNENPRVRLDVGGRTYTTGISIGGADPSLVGSKLLHLKSFGNNNSTLVSIENQNEEIFKIENNKETSIYGKLYVHSTKTKNDPNVSDVFGIWSTNGKLLQVNSDGLLLVREIKLNQTWADYVFEKQYPLMSLSELEKFVIKNKHLPNVPTAKEIEENGIGLSETNRIFIEKIEELTLYLIEQNKDVTLLKAKINSLEKEVESLKQK